MIWTEVLGFKSPVIGLPRKTGVLKVLTCMFGVPVRSVGGKISCHEYTIKILDEMSLGGRSPSIENELKGLRLDRENKSV